MTAPDRITATGDVNTSSGGRTLTIAAWSVAAVTTTAGLGCVLLEIVGPGPSATSADPEAGVGGVLFVTIQSVMAAAFAVLGAVVVSRQPRNPVGWLLVLIGFFFMYIAASAELYLQVVLNTDEPAGIYAYALWPGSWAWLFCMVPAATLLPLLFPTGRPLTPRWRWVVWLAVAAVTLTFVGSAFRAGPLDGTADVDNPLGIDSPVIKIIEGLGAFFLIPAVLTSIPSLILRFRRSSGAERQQIKVVGSAALLLPVAATGLGFGGDAGWPLVLVAMLIVAIAVTVAMLRYRLYDIDVVISRTLLVAGLAGFIAMAYISIVVGVGSLVSRGDEPNLVLSIAATALVAVAFQPVRRWLQRAANRLVIGRRATPYDVLSGFATRVGAAEATPETLVGLSELMADGTGAQPARVWLRVGAQLRSAAAWPREPQSADDVLVVGVDEVDILPDADLAVPVREQDELLGVLTIAKPRGERVSEVDVDLVERLAAASGVLLRNLRLDAELAQRLEEIQESRRRLVTAQDDARRRIEAELGGGTRAQLRSLREQLSLLARDVDTESAPKTAMLLDQLVTSTDTALDTLAGLAAGVYPPRLAADGLVRALTEQAMKAAFPVQVEDEGVGRYAPEVEAAVYFAVLEALQNAAKYAQPTSARIHLRHDGRQLSFDVVDDGSGFDIATTTLGTGLQGISDRLDTVGGTLTIMSTLGQGTTITGRIITTSATAEPAPELAGATP